MRTTVTLDPDVAARLKRVMRERGIGFKEAINTLLRSALGTEAPAAKPYRMKTKSMGARVDLTKANQIAAQLEDEEIIRKLELGK